MLSLNTPDWGKRQVCLVYSHSVIEPLKQTQVLTGRLAVLTTTDRQMQRDHSERRCYSKDGHLSLFNSSDKDIMWYYLSLRRPTFQEQTMMSGWTGPNVIEY